MRRMVLGLWLLCTLGFAGSGGASVPSNSIYHLSLQLTAQNNAVIGLNVFEGKPVLISMFYGSCPHVCPLLISRIKQLESSLPEDSRPNLRVLLVSLDPEKDTPRALSEVAERHRLDLTRWTLASAPVGDVRKLAAVLGIRYRKLPDGEYNHSTIITLLGVDGVIAKQTSNISGEDAEFLSGLKQAITTPR